nr:MAG TPA: U4/U6 small nuclear ribonucleoprotein [Caudoviricetes sp.]DAY22073.1 MAG TPA: U4/U6 small nuclear ribonucleoprotein [Caudoviricetes sp.]
MFGAFFIMGMYHFSNTKKKTKKTQRKYKHYTNYY